MSTIFKTREINIMPTPLADSNIALVCVENQIMAEVTKTIITHKYSNMNIVEHFHENVYAHSYISKHTTFTS